MISNVHTQFIDVDLYDNETTIQLPIYFAQGKNKVISIVSARYDLGFLSDTEKVAGATMVVEFKQNDCQSPVLNIWQPNTPYDTVQPLNNQYWYSIDILCDASITTGGDGEYKPIVARLFRDIHSESMSLYGFGPVFKYDPQSAAIITWKISPTETKFKLRTQKVWKQIYTTQFDMSNFSQSFTTQPYDIFKKDEIFDLFYPKGVPPLSVSKTTKSQYQPQPNWNRPLHVLLKVDYLNHEYQ